ncbi:uncharacterized protein LOC130817909 [Amaranthus tricolor]|uniref:uncharacterized protein LOC130817909 n=1 Tax=Amaranthus tricolor TaxID=29722 RepID=UPI0025881C50|nr:uncharacterized protein LOC130817909 [Amaranthus tricolor]
MGKGSEFNYSLVYPSSLFSHFSITSLLSSPSSISLPHKAKPATNWTASRQPPAAIAPSRKSTHRSRRPPHAQPSLCDYGELCSCSLNGRSHSYSNEILMGSKKDLEAYQKVFEDDATSVYNESPPTSPIVEKVLVEDDINLVVPNTSEDVIASRAKLNPKKRA